MNKRIIGIISLFLWVFITAFAQKKSPALSGKIITKEKEEVPFATVYLKGTNYGCATNEEGLYHLVAPEGDYTLVVSAVGYETVEKPIQLVGERQKMNIVLSDSEVQLDEVVIMANGVSRVNRSAFNAVAIGTENLQNSTKNLSEALARTPGLKLRESGGVGSDMSMMLDGFTGKHVKIFIDGVPQEGVGEAFGLNNIPINYAERIEVYKGVVPVGFGTDALGGVINIVTSKDPSIRINRMPTSPIRDRMACFSRSMPSRTIRITAIGWIPRWSSSMPMARRCSIPPWRSMCSVSTMPTTTKR